VFRYAFVLQLKGNHDALEKLNFVCYSYFFLHEPSLLSCVVCCVVKRACVQAIRVHKANMHVFRQGCNLCVCMCAAQLFEKEHAYELFKVHQGERERNLRSQVGGCWCYLFMHIFWVRGDLIILLVYIIIYYYILYYADPA
jgi:hypothetical protein